MLKYGETLIHIYCMMEDEYHNVQLEYDTMCSVMCNVKFDVSDKLNTNKSKSSICLEKLKESGIDLAYYYNCKHIENNKNIRLARNKDLIMFDSIKIINSNNTHHIDPDFLMKLRSTITNVFKELIISNTTHISNIVYEYAIDTIANFMFIVGEEVIMTIPIYATTTSLTCIDAIPTFATSKSNIAYKVQLNEDINLQFEIEFKYGFTNRRQALQRSYGYIYKFFRLPKLKLICVGDCIITPMFASYKKIMDMIDNNILVAQNILNN